MNEKKDFLNETKEIPKKFQEGVDTATQRLSANAEKLGEQVQAFEGYLEDAGARLVTAAKELCDVVSKQARQHPWATGSVAFVAGALAAYALRRRR